MRTLSAILDFVFSGHDAVHTRARPRLRPSRSRVVAAGALMVSFTLVAIALLSGSGYLSENWSAWAFPFGKLSIRLVTGMYTLSMMFSKREADDQGCLESIS